jgi:DeoR/GlpR family transcriptional regulator of sugar metabolism
MLPLQRKQAILDYLSRHNGGAIADLSKILNVSDMTIRRDLKELEIEGSIKRTHGGAVSIDNIKTEPRFDEKEGYHQEVKEAIAEFAAKNFISDNDIILMEGGTTVAYMASYLKPYNNLTIVTNGLYTASALHGLVPKSTVICCGGTLREISATFVGPMAEQFFTNLNANTVFLSSTGFTIDEGFTDPNLLEGQLKRAMSAVAKKKIMLVDSTKLGYCSFLTTFPINEIDILITDSGISKDMIEQIEKKGVKVYTVNRQTNSK